ncbi:Hypothetical protein A7982_11375 [Minicystis rosea]|nr:Hypothetical protein A7982_11375 [Minicystis rosea]
MVHVVRQGECFGTIAARHGFADWRAIYQHPENADLRKKRPDPNLLFPGDRVVVPEKEQKEISIATDRVHRIRVKVPERRLRVRVLDHERAAYKGASYRVSFDGVPREEGKTDGDGLVDVIIPPGAESAELSIGEHTWHLALGHLNPILHTPDEGVSGLKARLHNLGYDAGAIDEPLDPESRAAIRWFQRDHGLDLTDQLDEATRAAIVRAHGS